MSKILVVPLLVITLFSTAHALDGLTTSAPPVCKDRGDKENILPIYCKDADDFISSLNYHHLKDLPHYKTAFLDEHLFPGALIRSSDFINSERSEQIVPSKTLQYTVNFPGVTYNFTIKPTYKNYIRALSDIQYNHWLNNDAKKNGSISLEPVCKTAQVLSQAQLIAEFDPDVIDFLHLDFSRIANSNNTVSILKCEQKHYDVRVNSTFTTSEIFSPHNALLEELNASRFSWCDPPIIVDSVSYGVMFYLVLKSASTDSKSRGNFSEDEYHKMSPFVSEPAIIMGGSEKFENDLLNVALHDGRMSSIRNVLKAYSEFNETSAGTAIRFSVKYINPNNGIASDDKITTKCKSKQDDVIREDEETENSNIFSLMRKKIDTLISDLNYDANYILTYKGHSINKPSVESHLEDDRFTVLTYHKKFLHVNQSRFLVADKANETVLFPGSLITLKNIFAEEELNLLEIPRKSLRYTISLPLKENRHFEILPIYSAYQKALNHILNNWYEGKDDAEANAIWDNSMIYSRDQMRVKFGFEDTERMNISFEALENNKLLVKVYRWEQTFCNVTVESPSNGSNLFRESISAAELVENSFNSNNPPLMVSSVSYGRLAYVVLSTTSTNSTARDILRNGKEDFYHLLENFEIRIPILRGGSFKIKQDVNRAQDLAIIRESLTQNRRYDPANPIVPIRYTSIFIKDKRQVILNSSAEYLDPVTVKIYESSVIQLTYRGDYKVKFFIQWNEIAFDTNGEEIVIKTHSWDKNGQQMNQVSEQIRLSGNARAIELQAWGYAESLWGRSWKKIYDQKNLQLVKFRELKFDEFFKNQNVVKETVKSVFNGQSRIFPVYYNFYCIMLLLIVYITTIF